MKTGSGTLRYRRLIVAASLVVFAATLIFTFSTEQAKILADERPQPKHSSKGSPSDFRRSEARPSSDRENIQGSADSSSFSIQSANATLSYDWVRQFGSDDYDAATNVSIDGDNNVYTVGNTQGSLSGNTSSGFRDVFLIKHGQDGDFKWSRQFGSNDSEYAWDVATAPDGSVYAVGCTYGSLHGNPNLGGEDAYLVKYGPSGDRLWTRQFGSSSEDCAYGVALNDQDNIYVAGETAGSLNNDPNAGSYDAFLIKFDSSGQRT